MAKTGAPRGRTRQSRRLNPEIAEEENVTPGDQAKDEEEVIQTSVEDKPETEDHKGEGTSTDAKCETGHGQEEQPDTTSTGVQTQPQLLLEEEIKDEADDQAESGPADVETEHQVKDEPEDVRTAVEDKPETEDAELEAVIKVKGTAPTVSVSWEEQDEDEPLTEPDDSTRTDHTEVTKEEQAEMTSTDVQEDAELPLKEEIKDEGEAEKAPTSDIVLIDESEEESTEKADGEIEIIGNKEAEEAEDKEDVEMDSSDNEDNEKSEQEEEEDESNNEAAANGKRKAESSIDSSPSKKVKIINDGYCLYVGNLNNSKYYNEIRNALKIYFMSQSLMVQDVRLDKAKKHAFVDLASQMDLTKALTLNGQTLLDKPLKIAKAKVKEVDLVKKKKDPQEVQRNKNERCIHVENIPSSATRQDVLKVFPKAIAVRFLGGTESPSKGVAFVEFQNKYQAEAAQAQSGTAVIQGCVLSVNMVRENAGVRKTKTVSKKKQKEEPTPSDTLFVSNLPVQVQKKHLKQIFKKAVQINIPQRDGKCKGYAFVEFASVALAEKALKASKNSAIQKRPLKVQFGLKSVQAEAPSNTLIVLGLHERTTAETLGEAFEGALSSRIFVDKDTGLSRQFGFVEFESVDSCRRAKKAAEDVQIDGCNVTVAFARPRCSQAPDPGEREPQRGGKKANTAGKGHKGGRKLKKSKNKN